MIIIFMIVLYGSVFLKDVYSYGGYIEVFLSVVLFFVSSSSSRKKNLSTCVCLLLPVLIFNNNSIIYFIGDVASALLVLLVIDLAQDIKLSPKQSKIISILYLLYMILFLVFMKDSTRYDGGDNRYIGLLPSSTVSSSVLMVLLIGFIEKYKESKHKFWAFAFCVIIVVLNVFVCKTRSVLFVFPYLVYAFYRTIANRNLRILSFVITICIVAGITSLLIRNADTLRLSADEASSITRIGLYEKEWEMIKDAHFIVPAGFQSCTKYIQGLTSDEFSPHNDFFRYWVDWGVFWLFYLSILLRKIKKFAKENDCIIPMCLIFLFIASCALHNILLYSYIWVPMILIISNYRKTV